jgi:hypothetical protein
MQYKTIVLQLLQDHPEMYEQLRSQRLLSPTMERYAGELKRLHTSWMELLPSIRPESEASQVSSEALELALENLRDHLRNESLTDDPGPLTLEDAMAFLRRPTPPV